MERMVDFNGPFWRALGSSRRTFCLLFAASFVTSFLARFFSMLERFGDGFGRPKRSKNRDFFRLLGYAFRDLNFGRFLFDF